MSYPDDVWEYIETRSEIPLQWLCWCPYIVESGHFRRMSPSLAGYYLQTLEDNRPTSVVSVLCKRKMTSDVASQAPYFCFSDSWNIGVIGNVTGARWRSHGPGWSTHSQSVVVDAGTLSTAPGSI